MDPDVSDGKLLVFYFLIPTRFRINASSKAVSFIPSYRPVAPPKSGVHIHVQNQQIIIGFQCPKFGSVFTRFVKQNLRVVDATGYEHIGIILCFYIIIR